MNLTQILQAAVGLCLESGEIQCAEEINQGFCADFADSIMTEHKETFSLEYCDSYDLYEEKVLSSSKYSNVSENNPVLKRLHAIARVDVNYKSNHIFLYSLLTEKFYDAETSQGVTDPLTLPIFKRYCDEVEQLKRFTA